MLRTLVPGLVEPILLRPDPSTAQFWGGTAESTIALMTDDLMQVLTRFHREVFMPDMQRLFEAFERRLVEKMHARLAAAAQRLERLEPGPPTPGS